MPIRQLLSNGVTEQKIHRMLSMNRALGTIPGRQGVGADKVKSLLRLQRQYGNRFVQRMIAQEVIRPKVEEEEKEPLQRIVAHDVIQAKLEEEEEKKEGSETFADASLHKQGVTPAPVAIQRSINPGEVRFNNCSDEDLANFAVIPEEGTATFAPTNGVLYEADGFWWRPHNPKTEWFKISADCEVDITCTSTESTWAFTWEPDCTFSTPGWTSDGHDAANPF